MLTSIDPSMLSSSSILYVQVCAAPQIFSKQQMSLSELSFVVLTLETSEMSAIFFTKQLKLVPTSPRTDPDFELTRPQSSLSLSPTGATCSAPAARVTRKTTGDESGF